MTSSAWAKTLLLAGAAVIMAGGAGTASAQPLFERIFGVNREAPRQMQEAPLMHEQAPRPVPTAPRVTGPQYYDYKADALVRVDLPSIVSAFAPDTRARHDVMATHSIARAETTENASGTVQLAAAGSDNAMPQAGASPRGGLEALAGYELLAEKEIADALKAHYAKKPAFIWVDDEGLTHRGEAALAILRDADAHGLSAADYQIPEIRGSGSAQRTALARAEMALSARVLRYARDANGGRIDPNRISGYHDFERKELDLANVLNVLSDTFAVDTYLLSFHPQGPEYAALKKELAQLRQSDERTIVVDPRTLVRPGETNGEFAKILQLIERDADAAFKAEFGEVLETHRGSTIYSNALVPVIKAAQERTGAHPDGIIGPRTVAAIAGNSVADKIGMVAIAMEQRRWLPNRLAQRHVFINAPAFTASYHEGGEEKLSMRTVVGRNETQTYFFQDEISYVEFHPYWGIPRSILINTYLPRLYQDPSYLDRIGYELFDRNGRTVSSSAVNWPAMGTNIPFNVRQPPGPRNALGEVKIMFPNKHAIYMHDTPEKHLFARESRNLSNGCVRLEDPRAMTAAVLGWDRARVDERLNGGHGRSNLDVKVPVYVAYFTAWPDAQGKIAYHPDVYSRDAHMRKAFDKLEGVRAPGA